MSELLRLKHTHLSWHDPRVNKDLPYRDGCTLDLGVRSSVKEFFGMLFIFGMTAFIFITDVTETFRPTSSHCGNLVKACHPKEFSQKFIPESNRIGMRYGASHAWSRPPVGRGQHRSSSMHTENQFFLELRQVCRTL
ncbi:conserved hypothetical protein [Thiomonas arsenitoxydans]|uniref:Uncharacterized protein n=1 Tax=Thiomonas arsenitoxydans (strain DSM 22701 / CIP 110005 / 3As) TaxID=426114 RepID=D6CMA5_THIA3|nr:hypothetical protein THI_3082 [Thiomonas arsenitoxydans]CQR31298.1 conserved hypothetical protein [Thiomonas arsenitoxydans]CQR35981.1 conserved hypothetical protein [Thiomonas arsenitoxydans]CQR39119.1 conserved hypothetical protein [Thiomonas arsenitoxydans]CQR39217.1 conserved hypothetical protein [Thiomonas arsenitoxydans]